MGTKEKSVSKSTEKPLKIFEDSPTFSSSSPLIKSSETKLLDLHTTYTQTTLAGSDVLKFGKILQPDVQFYKDLAEKRREALNESLNENEKLWIENKEHKEEVKILKDRVHSLEETVEKARKITGELNIELLESYINSIKALSVLETEDASKEPTKHKKSKKAKKAKKATEDIDEKKNSNIQSVETNDRIHNLTDQQASLDRKMKKKLEKEIEGGSNLQSSQKEFKKHKKHKKASKDMEDTVKSTTEEERSKQIEQTCMANSVNTVHESDTKLQLSATIEINKSIEKSNMDAVAKELTKPKKSKKAKKSSKNKEKEEPEQSKKRKADTEEIMEDSIKCDNNKKKKSKKDKENKNKVINESETHNNLIAGEKDRKKKENLKINGKYDDIIGFKGTNVLSIKGYGVK